MRFFSFHLLFLTIANKEGRNYEHSPILTIKMCSKLAQEGCEAIHNYPAYNIAGSRCFVFDKSQILYY